MWCCCQDTDERHQAVFASGSAPQPVQPKERLRDVPQASAGARMPPPLQLGKQRPPPQRQAAGGSSCLSNRSTASSMSPEERLEEKARLQELVKSFARRGLQGVVCTTA